MENDIVGKVLVDSWGYSMVIVDFYRVVKATDKTVVVIPMTSRETAEAGTNGFAGTSMPEEDMPNGAQTRLRIIDKVNGRFYRGTVTNGTGTKMCPPHTLFEWDGRPMGYDHCD